ncbi:MAG: hypothetical protein ABIO43_11495 [Sphingomicrobium sp.]
MMLLAALAALIPPTIPPNAFQPIGPVRGKLECLLDVPDKSETADVWIDEGDPATQAMFRGLFPLDAGAIDKVLLSAGSIKVVSKKDRSELYRFDRIERGAEGDWWRYRVGDRGGMLHDAGTCFGRLLNNATSVQLRRIRTFKLEVVK